MWIALWKSCATPVIKPGLPTPGNFVPYLVISTEAFALFATLPCHLDRSLRALCEGAAERSQHWLFRTLRALRIRCCFAVVLAFLSVIPAGNLLLVNAGGGGSTPTIRQI